MKMPNSALRLVHSRWKSPAFPASRQLSPSRISIARGRCSASERIICSNQVSSSVIDSGRSCNNPSVTSGSLSHSWNLGRSERSMARSRMRFP